MVPSGISATECTVPMPRSWNRATACGLWMIGPRVTTGPRASSATSITLSTVRRTPQQNPAVLAMRTSTRAPI